MSDLYDDDTVLWSEQQARVLRAAAHAGTNLAVDWNNVAEEIESLGKSLGRELTSRITTILIHLMKLAASSAEDPRKGWAETIREQRGEIELLLEDSPSLRPTVTRVIAKRIEKARDQVRAALLDYGEQPGVDFDSLAFTEEQVLGNWFPDTPP
jgi:hypothetical protein